MRWKFHFPLIQILMKWSQQNFAHGMTAMLSWRVQNFVVIWSPAIELQLNEISIEFELWWKNHGTQRPTTDLSASNHIAISKSRQFQKHTWHMYGKNGKTTLTHTHTPHNRSLFSTHIALQWRHNECDVVSNHQPHDCLLNRLLRRRSKKTSKIHVTGLYEGISPMTGGLPTQRASNAENVSIWSCNHGTTWKMAWIVST